MRERTGIFIFYTGAIGFSIGIFVRSFYVIDLPVITWVALVAVVMGLVAGRRSNAPSARYALLASVILFGAALGALRFEVATWDELHPELEARLYQEIVIEGVIVREPDERERTTQLYVESGDVLFLVTADRFQEFTYGDVVTVQGVVEKPDIFTTDLGREFDYPGYLQARGVTYILPFAEVTVVDSGAGNPIIAALLATKHAFMRGVELHLPEPAAGLGEGLLLGVKRALGSELESAFRTTGIIHIVVLSGYNVMLVVTFVLYVLSFFLRSRAQAVVGISAVAAFALLVVLSATVVRASIMAGILLLLSVTGRVYLVMRALVLAGLIMLLLNPYLLVYDTGFQLSFLATLGLIVLAPTLVKKFTAVPTIIGVREFLVATIATQIFVLPILLYQIGEFSVVAVIVNVLVLPMVPIAMLLTFITGLASFAYGPLATMLAVITNLSLTYIVAVATWFAALPFASFVVPAFPFWLVPISYGAMAYLLYRYHKSESVSDKSLASWVIVDEETYIKSLNNNKNFSLLK